jgi:tetratricopeptide (TPR) repeat protein
MLKNKPLRPFQNFSFGNGFLRFNGKIGLLTGFSTSLSKTNRVLEQAPLITVFILILFLGEPVFSQSASVGEVPAALTLSLLYEGIDLYGQRKWDESLRVLRTVEAEAVSRTQKAEALYWIGLAELAAGDYAAALGDMEALEVFAPDSVRVKELAYHKGRAFYFLGRYNDAIISLKKYADAVPVNGDGGLTVQNASKKASALYWVGESLYSMGQYDMAGEIFLTITESYPQSPKYEASFYRLALINQKKVEAELLSLLKWTHEESLKTMEEYQRRERSYDQALIAYQKRIAEMLKDTRLSDLETENVRYRQQLATAEERIRLLEDNLREALAVAGFAPQATAGGSQGSAVPAAPSPNTARRLNSLKSSAMGLMDEILSNSGDVSAAPEPEK